MTGVLVTITTSLWILTVLGWVIYNLYQKNVKLENMVINQANFIASLRALIKESERAVKTLDDKIWLESDKELQEVYHNLKAVQEGLNQFSRE